MVHDFNGKEIVINSDHIIQVKASEVTGGSHIYLILDFVTSVMESPDDIYKMVNGSG